MNKPYTYKQLRVGWGVLTLHGNNLYFYTRLQVGKVNTSKAVLCPNTDRDPSEYSTISLLHWLTYIESAIKLYGNPHLAEFSCFRKYLEQNLRIGAILCLV